MESMFKLAWDVHVFVSPDSAEYYARQLFQLAKQKKKYKYAADALHVIGVSFQFRQQFDLAITYYERSLAIRELLNERFGIASSLINMGSIYKERGNYAKAINYYNRSLLIYETINNNKGIASCLLNIGNIHLDHGNNDKALEFFQKSRKYFALTGNKSSEAMVLNNIAMVKYNLKHYSEALKDIQLSLNIARETESWQDVAVGYYSLGTIQTSFADTLKKTKGLAAARKNYYDAIASFIISDSIQEQIGYYNLVVAAIGNIGVIYKNLGDDANAKKYLLKSLAIAQEIGDNNGAADVFYNLYKLYKRQGKQKEALESYERFINLRDSVKNEENRNEVIKQEFKYAYEKQAIQDSVSHAKENEIKDLEIREQEAQLKAKRNQQYALFGGLALVIVFAGFIYNRFKITQKQKHIIEQKEQETQEQNKIISHQKHLVEEKQKEILDSINYAKRIQYTLLAHQDFLSDHLPNHFVYFHPKDIVSGDFYWATKKDNKFFIAACDSTGHGVPGAFMSLLNISFLNEAVSEKNIVMPNEILNFARKRLIENISKEGQKDGFDGILCCLDLDKTSNKILKITYAAANNSPVVIRNNEIIELDSDRMPVGMGERKEDFKLFEIDFTPGDMLYLYTDGYADQFGGPKGKKFKYKPLNELLLKLSGAEMSIQKNELSNAFESWRGNLEQVDDVTIIGIKL